MNREEIIVELINNIDYYDHLKEIVERYFNQNPTIAEEWEEWFNPDVIYIKVTSTDCDHVTTTRTYSYDTEKDLQKSLQSIAESADGPWGYERISKEEYENHNPTTRDRIMEAHENGHPHTVRY